MRVVFLLPWWETTGWRVAVSFLVIRPKAKHHRFECVLAQPYSTYRPSAGHQVLLIVLRVVHNIIIFYYEETFYKFRTLLRTRRLHYQSTRSNCIFFVVRMHYRVIINYHVP